MADNYDKIIASGAASSELASVVSEVVASRWDNWDLSPYCAYLVDVCDASLLPYLAEQFDVAGLQGLEMAETEQQKRDIIKRSIALHKYIGTPWAIREACRTVGFPVISIEEGVTATVGGDTDPNDWARFRVLIDIGNDRLIDASQSRRLRQFVEFYKNERSHLVNLGFWQAFSDEDSVFRPEQEQRDTLEVAWMTIPKPNYIPKTGILTTIEVEASEDWTMPTSKQWDDGGELQFSFNGTAGISTISVTSTSTNNTTANRTATVPITSAVTGRTLGELTVTQLTNWNAYSNAYSNAYNSGWIKRQ